MPKASTSNDKFMRASVMPTVASPSKQPSKTTTASEQPSPSRFSMEVTLDFDAGPGSIPSSTIVPSNASTQSSSLALQPRNMKSPSELGIPTTAPEQEPARRSRSVAKILRTEQSGVQLRNLKAIQSIKSPAATAAAATTFSFEGESSMICSATHRGQEMLFCAVKDKIVAVCARTRVVLQYLTVPTGQSIVLLAANPATAQVLVGLSNGIVHTYHPAPTSPTVSSPLSSAHARYRWINGPMVDCRPIFVGMEGGSFKNFQISCSGDFKLLVGHGDQLAVFLVTPTKGISINDNADVLWTTRLDKKIVSARISGDGQAIVYVLEDDGSENDTPFGARTFLRDFDDGAPSNSATGIVRSVSNLSVGIVYKPGPFLVHNSSVTQISFRGFGHTTSSSTSELDEGNDLLLTYCSDDNTVRVFSQNSWKQLIQWTTPPQTRADWVRGISAFNLGDLEPRKGIRKSSSSQPASRRPSLELASNVANRSFPQPIPAHPAPSTLAGAWIAEITFRSAFPALRLSRLSYLKRGSEEAQAAHFESVSAILPAGSIVASSVMGMGDMGLSVQGIWPAWHPWVSEGTQSKTGGTLSGSAMSFLGLSANNIATNGFFGDSGQGGTHSPPSELRVIASHPTTGNVVLMEFPLWGDQDFGAMELGSPLRYVLSLSEARNSKHAMLILDYESNKLCAQIDGDSKGVSISWRKHCSHLLLPESVGDDDEFDFSEQHQVYCDLSVVPAPLSLPSLKLPSSLGRIEDEKFMAVQWWPDDNYGGPPQMLCVCRSGTVLVYEMPPPWSALEPVMPSYDPITQLSISGSFGADDQDPSVGDDDGQDSEQLQEYEVMVAPHPEFGIGLRLEAQMDGKPAIAGSYKMHPLNGGALPAQKTGMVVLGDELVSVNGVSLEGISFDDIIAQVRQVGSDAAPGTPLCMRFRPVIANRRRANSSMAFSSAENADQSARRSREQILGISPAKVTARKTSTPPPQLLNSLDDSQRQALFGTTGEMQQEFARIIAAIPGAFEEFVLDEDLESLVVLLPWFYPSGTPSDLRASALLIVARGKCLQVQRLEVSADNNPNKGRCVDLGSFELDGTITKINPVTSRSKHWCISAFADKECSLVFLTSDDDAITFQHFPMGTGPSNDCVLRSFSPTLMGTMESRSSQRCLSVDIWSALPNPRAVESIDSIEQPAQQNESHRYMKSSLQLGEPVDEKDGIIDFRFISPGSLSGYPWIVMFTTKAAIVYVRAGGNNDWKRTLTLKYPRVPSSDLKAHAVYDINTMSPADSFPHLLSAIRNLIESSDEKNYIRSDWHPDSVLSYVCTENNGPMFALRRNVKGIFDWLSEWTHPDRSSYPAFNSSSRLGVTPLSDVKCEDLLTFNEDSEPSAPASAANLFASFTAAPALTQQSTKKRALAALQSVLCPEGGGKSDKDSVSGKEILGSYRLPPPLRRLNTDELRLLWAIGELLTESPNFKGLDAPAQHLLFCASLFRQIKEAGNDAQEEEVIQRGDPPGKPIATAVASHHFSKRRDFMLDQEDKKPPKVAIAAAGGLAALTSRTQRGLIDRCRPAGGQLDWEIARTLRMPFWVRSNDQLRKIADEIGKTIFLKTKDIMECALFFIMSGNIRTLKNLSLTDQTDSGRKFANFLTGYDFASPHGRRAAEKNAYSLLGKNRYNVAASFFLLAQPPMLKTAVETIVTKSADLELAFMVTRLVEAIPSTQVNAGFSLGSMGGGGGYGVSIATDPIDEETFADWTPMLGKASNSLLRDQAMQLAEGEPCFKALQLIWLRRNEEAARVLSTSSAENVHDPFPQSFDKPIKEAQESKQIQAVSFPFHAPVKMEVESANDRVIRKANTVIDFVSRPSLLNAMQSSVRSRWASTLLVCDALMRRGIELPSARCLLQNTHEGDFDKDDAKKVTEIRKQAGTAIKASSSIFDSFDAAPRRSDSHRVLGAGVDHRMVSQTKQPAGGSAQTASSIFDSFDAAPPPKQKQLSQPATGQMPSSIFDRFDAAPPPKQKQLSQPATGQMSPSIFDSFDAAPPPKQKQQPQPGTGQMSSSIFDSFDAAPPPKQKQQPQSATGQMSSSIFDSFDTAPPPKQKQQPQPATGQMSSSIFDSFGTAPPPKQKQQPQPATGQMSSSIFDSFDTAPPPNQKQQPQPATGQMSSSIFDSFDTAPPPKQKLQTQPASAAASSAHIFHSFDSNAGVQSFNPEQPVLSTILATIVTRDKVIGDDGAEIIDLPSLRTPRLWMEWRQSIVTETVARRLLREVGQLIDRLSECLIDPPIRLFSKMSYPLIPAGAAEILRTQCDGQDLLDNIGCCLLAVCKSCGLETSSVVDEALHILDSQARSHRMVLATLLHVVAGRADLAEDCIRGAAVAQIQRCDAFSSSHDDLVDNRMTAHHKSSQHLRRAAVCASWQLELCLWLHRGGAFPLSSIVLKEAIVAVRIGMVLASWGRNHECLDALIRNPPDCPLDHNGGRQLWTSMKLIAGLDERARKVGAQGSGGWEFLVDCQREEATAMLRKRISGSFIIRPHQDDNGVFTLSFKTNLMPVAETDDSPKEIPDQLADGNGKPPIAKQVKKNDVVQHAIIRLSDAGFRCGSFGPFTTLMKLLEAVSASLPFDLLFDKPPTEGIIKDEEHQPSPNAVFLRKFAFSSLSDINLWDDVSNATDAAKVHNHVVEEVDYDQHHDDRSQLNRFGVFCQLLTLSQIRKQLCAVAAADYDDIIETESSWKGESTLETDSVGSLSGDEPDILGIEERYACASRLIRPFLVWCHAVEILAIHVIAPGIKEISQESEEHPCALAFTESSIELAPHIDSSVLDGGDAMIRHMIQPDSGVEFRTLRVGEGGDSAMIVLFSKREAISWVKSSGLEKSDKDALHRLARMEERRVIEPIAMSDLNLKAFSHNHTQERGEEVTCYRFVDPWEVEALGNREGETKAAALGREHYLAFSVNSVANSCESTLRKLGGPHLLGLWSNEKGGLRLTKAVASVHPPWERDDGSDLQMHQGVTVEPTAFHNAIRQHLYRNALFRRLRMPQRFLALVQVELLDLKNLTAPGGASLSVYALLRLKRQGSSAPLTHKARTLDSAASQPMKIGKSTGPNAPASWGSLVRFRFPLPEDVNCDGTSFDEDREALFKGPPSMLQLSVYEKKFMSDIKLGGADVKLDALANGGQMEEWVPLRSPTHGVNWFVRMRLTLRFELMCLPSDGDDELPSSVGLTKIQKLSKTGGTHEDKVKKSASTPDILSYFESMVY